MTTRTPEDARTNPQPGDTLTVDDAYTYTVYSVTADGAQVRLTYMVDGVEEGTTWGLGTWSYRAGRGGDGRTWAPAAPKARCPRTDPQPGDVMRATHRGPTTATPEYTWTVTDRVGAPAARCPRTDPQPGDTLRHEAKGKTWTVDSREGNNVVVRPSFMSQDHTETWTVGFWGSSGVSWTYAVAETPAPPTPAPAVPERDPKADPQPGDAKAWTGREDPEYIHRIVVLARTDEVVETQVTYFNGTTCTQRRTLGGWASGDEPYWTWTRGDETPAPAETPAPEAPRAWYETRGLPACLAALPTPTDLATLDLWIALAALGHTPTDRDDSGRLTLAEGTTVYASGDGRFRLHWPDGHVVHDTVAGVVGMWRWAVGAAVAEAPRDARTDPQPGDTKTWTFGRHDEDYIREILVTARAGDKVTTQGTRYSGATYTCDDTVAGWASGGGWTFAPAGAPV